MKFNTNQRIKLVEEYDQRMRQGGKRQNVLRKMSEEYGKKISKDDIANWRRRKGPTLVFGDTHIPFDHPRYLEFLQDVYKQHKCSEVVCTGDLIDNHAISRHQSEPDSYGALDEYSMAKQRANEYVMAFPYVKMCYGNHDKISQRQAASLGIPSVFLKSFNELWNLPDTWIVKNAFVIDNVLYKHGINCNGKDGALNTAIQERMSTVIGHIHSFGGCKYIANHRDMIFGLNVGCGIDVEAYAFAYGKHSKYRPTLGCGVVYNSGHATFVPMDMSKYRRK